MMIYYWYSFSIFPTDFLSQTTHSTYVNNIQPLHIRNTEELKELFYTYNGLSLNESFLQLSELLLFVWGLSSHSRIFHSYWDVTITGEGLQILTCDGHSPLSSEGFFLAFHTYCDTDHPFICSSPRTCNIHTYCRALRAHQFIT